jgi:pimeloyl-ACP methyl ester carboxylesterase
MHRREFLEIAAGIAAASTLAACAPRVSRRSAIAARPVDAAAFHRERRFRQLPQGRIAYLERGQGSAALFLHGFPLNGFQWRGAIERLAPYRRCIAPDFLGLGYTEPADGQSCAPEAQVEMLVALLDALAVPAADVIANDSGGQAAQLLVAHHPGRVRSLLLTNCDAENDSPPPALEPVIELAQRGEFVDRWLAPWRADPVLARSAEGIGGMCYSDPAHPTDAAVETYFAPLIDSPRRKSQTHAYAIALQRNPLLGIAPALQRFAGPVRIAWGTADDIFSPASPDFLDRAFGNSLGVRRLAGRKLFWPEELPDVIAAEALALWHGDRRHA